MADGPLAVLCYFQLERKCDLFWRYKIFVLFLTFLCYTSYHLSRKPISVVKSVLSQNCATLDYNKTIELNSTTWCQWEPFVGHNADAVLGSLDYSYLFAYAIGLFFSGHIAERTNLRYFLTIGMVLSGIFTALFGFGYFWQIHSLPFFIIVQVMAGLFQSTGWPAVVAIVGNWFGRRRRGLLMGIWNAHTSVGNILGALIAGVWVDEAWGWSFIVPGCIMVVVGIILFLFLVPSPDIVGCRNSISTAEQVKNTSKGNLIPAESTEIRVDGSVPVSSTDSSYTDPETASSVVSVDVKVKEKPISIIDSLKIPGVIEFSLSLFFIKLVSYTFLFWLPNYIKETRTDLSASAAADLSTVFDVGGIFGGILAGILADHSEASAAVCCVMLFLSAPSVSGLPVGDGADGQFFLVQLYVYNVFGQAVSSWGNVVMLVVCGAFVNGPYALITTAVSADLGTHPSLKGNSRALATVSAIIDGTGSIGAAVGPLLTGIIASNANWRSVFWMLIGSNVIAFLLLLRLLVKEIRTLYSQIRPTTP